VGLKILSWKSRFQPAAVLLPQPVCSTARVELAIEPSMLTPKLRAKEPQTEETDRLQMGESCSLNYRESWILDNFNGESFKNFCHSCGRNAIQIFQFKSKSNIRKGLPCLGFKTKQG
jgi:hypothetical protein